jgi:hypothetical protein
LLLLLFIYFVFLFASYVCFLFLLLVFRVGIVVLGGWFLCFFVLAVLLCLCLVFSPFRGVVLLLLLSVGFVFLLLMRRWQYMVECSPLLCFLCVGKWGESTTARVVRVVFYLPPSHPHLQSPPQVHKDGKKKENNVFDFDFELFCCCLLAVFSRVLPLRFAAFASSVHFTHICSFHFHSKWFSGFGVCLPSRIHIHTRSCIHAHTCILSLSLSLSLSSHAHSHTHT